MVDLLDVTCLHTDSGNFQDLSDSQKFAFNSVAEVDSYTQDDSPTSVAELSDVERLRLFYACEYSNDEEWQLQCDCWMDLRYSATDERAKRYAHRVLREHACSEDKRFVHATHECRAPPDLRPSWARPVLNSDLPDFQAE